MKEEKVGPMQSLPHEEEKKARCKSLTHEEDQNEESTKAPASDIRRRKYCEIQLMKEREEKRKG